MVASYKGLLLNYLPWAAWNWQEYSSQKRFTLRHLCYPVGSTPKLTDDDDTLRRKMGFRRFMLAPWLTGF